MDIEGGEPKALAGFDLDRFRPELIVIEGKIDSGGSFTFPAVPLGTWNLVVVADGPKPYRPPKDKCWKHAVVDGKKKSISLGIAEIADSE